MEPSAWHPSSEQLSAFLERRLLGSERESVVAHLAECVECRREVSGATRLLASAKGGRHRISYGIIAAIAAALAFALVPGSKPRDASPSIEERPQRVVEPDVVRPIAAVSPVDGAVLTADPVVLLWHADAPHALYRVTLQDSLGGVQWRGSTTDTSVTVPDSARLKRGATYYWSVDAMRQDGRATTSRAQWFRR